MTTLLRRAFADFWQINIGHVGIVIMFVFGLGVGWRSISATQDTDREASLSRDAQIAATIRAAVEERNLKLEALAARVAREEAADSERIAQGKSVAELTAQMRSLEDSIKSLREDLRNYQASARR